MNLWENVIQIKLLSSRTQSAVVSIGRGCCLNLEFLCHSGPYAGDDMAALWCFHLKRGSFLRSLSLEKSHLLSWLIIHLHSHNKSTTQLEIILFWVSVSISHVREEVWLGQGSYSSLLYFNTQNQGWMGRMSEYYWLPGWESTADSDLWSQTITSQPRLRPDVNLPKLQILPLERTTPALRVFN